MMATPDCVICDKPLDESECRTLKHKSIETLINASKSRQDYKHKKFIGKDSLSIHTRCYHAYISQSAIKVLSQRRDSASLPATTRSQSSLDFNFEENCLLCGQDASEKFLKNQSKKKTVSKRGKVSLLQNEQTKATIVQKSTERADTWSNEVLDRIFSTENLIDAKPRYHKSCYVGYFRSTSSKDDPADETPHVAELIEKFINDHPDERYFSLSKVTENYEGSVPTAQWLKQKVYERLGNDIIITSNPGAEPVIYLRDTGHKILLKHFQEAEDDEPHRRKVVNAAAKIITEDIRAKEYDTNNYPSPHSFLEEVEKVIPESLRSFLETVILSNKRGQETKCVSKIVSIAHAIITCVRPRSFLSCLQIGLGAMLNQTIGSKSLLNILSSLGFCCSYDDSKLFEASVLSEPSNSNIAEDAFSQFIFDNADHNVNTIDGLHTFHAMGGIQCVTPASAVSCGTKIPKLAKIPPAAAIGSFGKIDLKTFHGYKKVGLGNVVVEDLNLKNNAVNYQFNISSTDFLWLYNYKSQCIDIQGWNGFMENLTKNSHYVKSRIMCLPSLNQPPSDYDTIYTVLNLAAEKMQSENQNVVFVTFDQPLYMKAKEIIHSSNDPNLQNVVVRLGGFHLLMSFLGSIGNIMDGSGLEELFSEIYAPASIDKMLAGHAYSKAIRAHILTHCALAQIIFNTTVFTEEDQSKLNTLLENSGTIFENINDDLEFENIKRKFIDAVGLIANNSDTAKLWAQYFHMVSLVKMFIEAERSGNWQLHLETVQRMLPFFHSSGRYLYAKCAHLYLQDMYNLQQRIDVTDYEKFINGCFTIRRTDKFWSGIRSDMTIEQALMRPLKDIGGPTQGRGMTDSVLSKWVLMFPALIDLTESVTEFCNVFLATTKQHIDSRTTRISRDKSDMSKIMTWLENHNPFPQTQGIISLSSGLKGDDSINCHKALEVGLSCLEEMWKVDENNSPKTFTAIKFKRKNRVTSLKSLTSTVEVSDEIVTIDPTLLFQRICVLQRSDEEFKGYFNHELAPYPLSLFDDKGMRKGQKSTLYDFFKPIEPPSSDQGDIFVMDGGFLLHKVVWQQKELFKDILTRYVNYVINKYSKNCIVVFDGYPDEADAQYTKSAERQRRMRVSSAPEVVCDENMPSTLTQEKFLSNEKNKTHLINILSERMKAEGLGVKQAIEDADYTIVETALSLCDQYNSVFIVGEDVDLLVILTQIGQSKDNLYFIKPGRGKIERKVFDLNSFIHPDIKHLIGFIHAFTGCDTTSALYKQGKAKLIKLLQNDSDNIRIEAECFNYPNACKSSVQAAGQRIIMSMYGAKNTDDYSFHDFRYLCFSKSTLKSTFNLSALPPTLEAANEHSLRVYLQVQQWQGDNTEDPVRWGWKRTNNALVPVTSKREPIPEVLIEIISCGCAKGNCTSNCSCRKVGLKCSILCKKCHGETCSNTNEPDIILSDDEPDSDFIRLTNDLNDREDVTYVLETEDNEENSYETSDDDEAGSESPPNKRSKFS